MKVYTLGEARFHAKRYGSTWTRADWPSAWIERWDPIQGKFVYEGGLEGLLGSERSMRLGWIMADPGSDTDTDKPQPNPYERTIPVPALDQKQAKHRPSRLPWLAIQAMSELTEKGAQKHGEHLPWEIEGAEALYREALGRHMISYLQGHEYVSDDPDTLELAAVAFNALALLELKLQNDDS